MYEVKVDIFSCDKIIKSLGEDPYDFECDADDESIKVKFMRHIRFLVNDDCEERVSHLTRLACENFLCLKGVHEYRFELKKKSL